jgi:hypothetical protein
VSLRAKAGAFLSRDLVQEASYRLNFVFQFLGMLFTLFSFYFLSKLIGRAAVPHLAPYGGDYFAFALTGVAFTQFLTVSLSAFSQQIRMAQVLGTLEAMLVSPTRTHMVIFASASWDFFYGAIRILLYIGIATLAFGIGFNINSWSALFIGSFLTLLSSAGIGILSASFILYFKRGDPVNFLLRVGLLSRGADSRAVSLDLQVRSPGLVAQGRSRRTARGQVIRRAQRSAGRAHDLHRDPRADRTLGLAHRDTQGQAGRDAGPVLIAR